MSDARPDARPVELLRALAVLADPPGEAHARLAEALGLGAPPTAAEHTGAWVLGLTPYASVYLGREGMIGGEARDRVAGFWRAVGFTPPAEPDHLGALLGLYAALAESGAGEQEPAQRHLLGRARDALLHEHLAPWLPQLLDRMVGEEGFYGAWARLLRRTLDAELQAVGPSGALPLHLRDVPAVPDPRAEGAGAFLAGLLAPARSGMILAWGDLGRLGREVGVGVRLGERRRVLEHLLGEEPGTVLQALADHARAAALRHGGRLARLGGTARWWQDRAGETVALLEALARDAAAAPAGAR